MWYATVFADDSGAFVQIRENEIPDCGKAHTLKVFSSESGEEAGKRASAFLKAYRRNPMKALYG